ncbi:MAG: hypothetical protein AAFY45_25315, partial [Bacteroidota bacterium]
WEILKALEFKFPGFSEFFVHWQKGEIALQEKNWSELSHQFKTAILSLPGLLRHLIPLLESRYQLGVNGNKTDELYDLAQVSLETGSWLEAKKQLSILLRLYDPSFDLSYEQLSSQHAFCERALQFNFLYERTQEQLDTECWEVAHSNLLKLIEWSSERLSPSKAELLLMLEHCEQHKPNLSSQNMSDHSIESNREEQKGLIVYKPTSPAEVRSRNLEPLTKDQQQAPRPKTQKKNEKYVVNQQRKYAALNRWVGISLLILAIIGLSYIFLKIEKEVPVYEVKQSKRLDLEDMPIENPIDQEIDFVRTGSMEDDLADK